MVGLSFQPTKRYIYKNRTTELCLLYHLSNKNSNNTIKKLMLLNCKNGSNSHNIIIREYKMLHKMKLQNEPFNSMKNGCKTIELRLYDDKRKLIKVGDKITFTLINGKESIDTTVRNLYGFDSFKSLYKNLPLDKCGYADVSKAKPEDMEEFYSKEEQSLFGVVGIEIERIKVRENK